MESVTCADARRWLRAAVQAKRFALPAPPLQAHFASCAICRGAPTLLLIEALGLPAAPPAIDHQAFLDDLPAFVEHEVEDPTEALRRYPHIWMHMIACQECAETYQMTQALLHAEQRDEIATPTPADFAAALKPHFQTLLRLTRQFLNLALPPPALSRVTRGHGDGPAVLSQGEVGAGRQFVLSVQEQPDQAWSIIVAVTPPPGGWLVLTLGEAVFRARFDERGGAVVADVPAALLAARDGPELVVGIEAEGDV